jgi:hypothetical protein
VAYFDVVVVVDVINSQGSFHPIFGLAASSASQALSALERKPLDAIVMLGTGMPTLASIAQVIGWNGGRRCPVALPGTWLKRSIAVSRTAQHYRCGSAATVGSTDCARRERNDPRRESYPRPKRLATRSRWQLLTLRS